MSSSRRNPSPSPSISSIISELGPDVSPEELEVRNFVKKRLMKRLFLGHYQERRYVEFLSVYRDMIVIHKSETDLQVDFDRVQSKLQAFYRGGKWFGMTSPDIIGAPAAGHCIWTKLQDVAFGFYWFQIRQIRFEEREIVARLKVIRPVNEELVTPTASSPSFTKSISDNVDTLKTRIRTSIHSLTESHSGQMPSTSRNDSKEETKQTISKSSCNEDKQKRNPTPDSTSDEILSGTEKKPLKMDDILIFLRIILTNWRDILAFFSAACVGTIHGVGKCIEYIGNFSLKFMKEFTALVRAVTPIILALIELVGKLVGGLYILLAMMFRKGNGPPIQQRQFVPAIQNKRPPPAIQYNTYPSRNLRNPRGFIYE